MSTPSSPRRDRRPRKRRRLLRFWIMCGVLAVVFAVGLALGQSLDDNPSPGRTQTSVRTLKPLGVPPVAVTVTVTVTR